MNIFISTWVLLVAGLIIALPMVHLRIKDYTGIEDETLYAQISSVWYFHAYTVMPLFHRVRLDEYEDVQPVRKEMNIRVN
jgi:hypothetical protein